MNRILLIAATLTLAGASAQAQPAQPPSPDWDKDGKVTLAEFQASQSQRTTRMFGRLDTNKDGWLSEGEMLRMQQMRARGT